MIILSLEQVPNQTLQFNNSGARYDVTIKEVNGIMAVDVSIDLVPVITGHRVGAGIPFLPYKYIEEGNFMIITENDELPYWDKFGDTQTMFYIDADEIEAIKNA